MVLTTPRTLGTPRRPGDRLVTVWLAATVLLTCAAGADAQSSNSRVARLSQDLAQLVATHGDFKPTTVIITASQEKVDRLAARHSLTVLQRLATGAVLTFTTTASQIDMVLDSGELLAIMNRNPDELVSIDAVTGAETSKFQITGLNTEDVRSVWPAPAACSCSTSC